jgi:hypothetical protein
MDIDDDLPKDPRSKAEKQAERREALIVIVSLPLPTNHAKTIVTTFA